MDIKLSHLIRGIIGVIFGLLALLLPELLLEFSYNVFLMLIGLVIIVFLFLAITSKGDESMFWFGLSAGLLVLAVITYLAQLKSIVEIVFLLLIAVIAFYNGFTDIVLALRQPRTKYFLIPGMFVLGVALLAIVLKFTTVLPEHLVIVTLGSFAFVFGLFSIVLAYSPTEVPKQEISEVKQKITCEDSQHEGKK